MLMQVEIGKEVGETLKGAKEDVFWLFKLIPKEVYENHWFRIVAALIILTALWRLSLRAYRFVRRFRPKLLNAKLAIYGETYVPREKSVPEMRREAAVPVVPAPVAPSAGRVAVSSSPSIVGYLVARRIDKIQITGCAGPDEALAELRLAAAGRGANAVLNVKRVKNADNTYAASGEAVVIAPEGPTRGPSSGAENARGAAKPADHGGGGHRSSPSPGGKAQSKKQDKDDDDADADGDGGADGADGGADGGGDGD